MSRRRGSPQPPTGPRVSGSSSTELGLAVQRRRLEAGWTVRRLAAELGVAPSTVSRVERGVMGPADAARAFAAWLGWTPEEVLLAATARRGL